MEFKVECKSPLLQYTLEYFLKDRLSENGILITDDTEKDGIIIGKDIIKPFNKATLIMQLEKNYTHKQPDFEEKLDELFENFKKELLQLIKEYNGKK